jgi:hypothetical protein
LIPSKIANTVGLHGKSETLQVRSAWCSGQLICESETVDFTITSKNKEEFSIRARKIDSLDLPVQKLSDINLDRYNHIHRYKDYLLSDNVKPEILIGQDHYHLLAPLETISEGKNRLYLICTRLGWCAHGIFYSTPKSPNEESINNISLVPLSDNNVIETDILTELNELIPHSFTLDSIGITAKPRQNKEKLRAIQILDDTSKLVNGHWEVGLPWKSDVDLPNSFTNAFKRSKIVENNYEMRSSEEYASRYQERIKHLLQNDYAREVQSSSITPKRIWYLPHFGVDNPYKKKLRVVSNAAAKSIGYSLNDHLLPGPDLIQSLLGIMLRFREVHVAIARDIKFGGGIRLVNDVTNYVKYPAILDDISHLIVSSWVIYSRDHHVVWPCCPLGWSIKNKVLISTLWMLFFKI